MVVVQQLLECTVFKYFGNGHPANEMIAEGEGTVGVKAKTARGWREGTTKKSALLYANQPIEEAR